LSHRPSFLRSTALLTAVNLISQGLGFLYRIAVAQLVGSEVLGLFQLLMSGYGVLQSLCISGLAVAVSVLTATFHAQRNSRAQAQLLRLALSLLALFWIAAAAIVLPGRKVLAQRLLGDGRLATGLVLLLPVLLLTGVENLQKHAFYGLGETTWPAAVELGEQCLRCTSILLLLLAFPHQRPEQSVALMICGMLASEIFSAAALTLARLRRRRDRQPSGQKLALPQLGRKLGRIALPVSLTAVAGNLLGAATAVLLPQLLVGRGLSSQEAVSEFGVLMGMTLPILMLPMALVSALSLSLLPRLTEQYTLGQRDAFCALGARALEAVSELVLPLIALLAAWTPTLGRLLFGDARVGQQVWLLALGVLASGYHAILATMLNALGRQRQNAAFSLLGGGVELLATVWLVPRWGLAGFGVSFACAQLLTAALCLALVHRAVGLRIALFDRLVAPALSALLAALVVRLGAQLSPSWALPLWGVLGPGFYLLLLLAQGRRPSWAVGRIS
jgi:O-antigen/teichoic acid export membrane protein